MHALRLPALLIELIAEHHDRHEQRAKHEIDDIAARHVRPPREPSQAGAASRAF